MKSHLSHHASNESPLLAEFDELTQHAAHGDRRAIGIIAIVLGAALYDEALTVSKEHAVLALQDFLDELAFGAPRFHPPVGRPMTWMRAMVRASARRRRNGQTLTPRQNGDSPMEDTQIDRLYKNHARSLCGLANDILRDLDQAEDVVHDAVVRLDEEAGDVVAPDHEVLARLQNIVRRLCHERRYEADRRRMATRRPLAPPTPPTPIAVAMPVPEEKEEAPDTMREAA